MHQNEIHAALAALDSLIQGLDAGADKTALQAAIETVINKLYQYGLNELPTHIRHVRAGVA
jgi:hypothetical protein